MAVCHSVCIIFTPGPMLVVLNVDLEPYVLCLFFFCQQSLCVQSIVMFFYVVFFFHVIVCASETGSALSLNMILY